MYVSLLLQTEYDSITSFMVKIMASDTVLAFRPLAKRIAEKIEVKFVIPLMACISRCGRTGVIL